jgi:hypothetical protein
MGRSMDKGRRTKFNGYIYVDPDLEVGDRAILDGEDEVIVVQMGKIFAEVRKDDMKWRVMLNRLEKYERVEKEDN